MNKEAKEHLSKFLIAVETRWVIIGGISAALIFNLGLFIGILFGNH